MQVVCRKAKGNAEVHCCVCGQGFVMFWERQSAKERAAARQEIQESLRRHHRLSAGREPHPQGSFLVPDYVAPDYLVPKSNESTACTPHWQAPAWEL